MHLHILGICGTFMGGIAALARAQGHTVTGCDAQTYPPMSTQLETLSIALTSGYEAEQLDTVARNADVFVIGNALSRGNPLVEAILERNLPYTSGPQWLAENVLRAPTSQGQPRHVLAVAGTHGKTTTASMLAWILDHVGLRPGFLIGGVPAGFQASARLTDSPFFVIEADEYDTAFFDKRSKFVHYRPRTAILNNLEFDHADIFADLAAIETQFHHLVRTVPPSGHLIVNFGNEALDRVLARGVWSEVVSFGSSDDPDGGTGSPEWELVGDGEFNSPEGQIKKLSLPQPGKMNALNALAAIAAARQADVSVDDALAALAAFPGVARRLERRGEARGITVYDDFAHHPTAIAATLEALRSRIGNARLIAVLEPRSNTMKLGTMKAALPDSLRGADAVYCYAAHLGWDAAAALAPLGEKAQTFGSLSALQDALVADTRAGDHVLIMSNGGFGGIHQKLLAALS
ncbi:MAG: UDP-N-acetylmuramate:L-alanyl-gamma-D-glutamyl-meso-diaminopimelate ligase [Betaproteobacteria bacterium]|nr:UDP-N-acetylmuramate:L-alanyl-gamma-D-glutamyl-meso-diaminopimelate ligase [Betaproteobacteria bacterium]